MRTVLEGGGPLDVELGDDPSEGYYPPDDTVEAELAAQREVSAALLKAKAERYKNMSPDGLDDLLI
jgi:hypothetical protein